VIPRVPTRETPVWAVIALVVVVTAVVLMILTFVVLLPSLNNTPTNAINGFVHDLNDGDIAAALDHTIVKFADSELYWDMYDELDDELESLGDYHFAVSDIVVTYSDDMAIDLREEAEVSVAAIEELWDITIDDFCLLEYTLYTASTSMDDHYGNVEMACVLVDGNWYIVA